MTTASKITLVRVAFIPLFMILMYLSGGAPGLYMWLALGVFILASITDYIDGYIEASNVNESSFKEMAELYVKKENIKTTLPPICLLYA